MASDQPGRQLTATRLLQHIADNEIPRVAVAARTVLSPTAVPTHAEPQHEAVSIGRGAQPRSDNPDVDPESPAEEAAGGPPVEPVEGYDGFTIAQLRGRLRGYQLSTVQQLLNYEQATRAREPYLRMLSNRLARLRSE